MSSKIPSSSNKRKGVDKKLREICLGIESRYEICFVEIGTEQDHVHYLIQSVPAYSPEKIVRTIKSITARKILESCPEVKKMLWEENYGHEGIISGQ